MTTGMICCIFLHVEYPERWETRVLLGPTYKFIDMMQEDASDGWVLSSVVVEVM